METRTVELRLVVRSRHFYGRVRALDDAVSVALSGAAAVLLHSGFVVESQGAEIVNDGIAAGLAEADKQSRPDDVT